MPNPDHPGPWPTTWALNRPATMQEIHDQEIRRLEARLTLAEAVIAEARPIAEALERGATQYGSTLFVTSALARAIDTYDKGK